MSGPDQVVDYLTVRVQERLHKDRTLGALMIEPAMCRATFMWTDGRTAAHSFPSEEIERAVQEADQMLAGIPIPAGEQWLGGLAGKFELRWGQLIVLERKVMSVHYAEPVGDEVNRILSACLAGSATQ